MEWNVEVDPQMRRMPLGLWIVGEWIESCYIIMGGCMREL